MSPRYFKLSPGVVPGGWALGIPTNLDGTEVENPWMFKKGTRLDAPMRLRMPVARPGSAVDFSLAGIGTPVVHTKVASLLEELAPDDVQFIPVEIEEQPEQFSILVVARLVRCIDDAASAEVEYWKPEDGRPEKVGQYRKVSGMRINAAAVGDAKVFRTRGWSIAVVVSEDIKDALERIGVTGMQFTEV
ncbi:hypothetical protein HPC49_30045 [Pyxidicoccus fallax]|uniref:Immunity MXAN-0049 protein domain-containing protein n=1 Tax=Pyxidicoccus fallax TaxID=394095 RepID=A0A848LUM0_9BACT|nr:DUF1629 domain-containing protein [Pyxidicoccus fallax]NMO21359.1 hypothetical protein [Pyxidicoccus fallax]NPC82451.1 hypothetical protein [Pyxidicoccus fallax]